MAGEYRYLFIPLGIIIILGVVGNIISCLVWFRGKKCCNSASSTYFKLLAINDLLVLLIPATFATLDLANKLWTFLPMVNDFSPEANKIEYISDFLCKFHQFTYTVLPQVSAWITVALTTERTLCLCFPLKFYRTDASKRAYIITGLITVASVSLNITEITDKMIRVLPFTVQQQNGGNITMEYVICSGTKLVRILESLSFIVFTFTLPFVILILCNIIIIIKLCRPPPTSSQHEARQRSIRNVTKLTLYVSVVQCATNLPRAYYEFLNHGVIGGEILSSKYLYLYIEIAFVCYYMNNSVNWIIYCIVGKDFKQDLKELCQACCGSFLHTEHQSSTSGKVIQKYSKNETVSPKL